MKVRVRSNQIFGWPDVSFGVAITLAYEVLTLCTHFLVWETYVHLSWRRDDVG